ncbi:Tn7 transposase TnsA N-terminal domain-containing protein [Pseudomonas aeruginosa]|uniref:Tn7 transposase TnsA N-terminal domain-containing protein n=1 Tax=Pseudomonas aeruginosa TaxID=287 RepID=UPI0021C6EACF|nr:Tn7 transposase TnsA N-terminal domain-containing protein [Pseudomonas aeruginosa]
MKRDDLSHGVTRDVARRNNRGRKAYVMKSLKSGLEIRLESRDELALAKALDLDPRGSQLRAQAMTFDLVRGEVLTALPTAKHRDSRYYTPDLSDVIDGIEHIFEVKPKRYCSQHKGLFEQVRDFCLRNGMKFRVLCKEDFTETFLINVDLLHKFARQCAQQLPAWAQQVSQIKNKTGHVRDVLCGLAPENYFLLAGLLSGVLRMDLNKALILSMDFDVYPGNGNLQILEVYISE